MDQIINHFAYLVLTFAVGHFFGLRRGRILQNADVKSTGSIPDAVFKRNKQKRKPVFVSEEEQFKREQRQPPEMS